MGSFDKICGISGMTIRGDEPCYVTGLEKQKFVYRMGANIFEVDQEWQPISFPQLTTYYDYGYVAEDYHPNPINAFLGFDAGKARSSDENDEETEEDGAKFRLSDTFFLVHKTVYETFSNEIVSPDVWGYREEIVNQGPAYFVNAFEEAKKLCETNDKDKIYKFGMFNLYLENSHAFGWKHSKIGWKIMNLIMKDNSFDVLTQAVDLGLTEELYRQFIFEQNMGAMWKHYRPSNYGGQDENRKQYLVLAELIKQVANEKVKRWDEYEED